MRSMNLSVLVLVGLSAIVGTASGGIVGVDVSGSVYTGPGVLDAASRTWELKPSTGNTFLLDGQTITMTYGTNWAGGINAPIDLFDDYKHNGGGAAFGVVLTGLDLSKQYNLVVYGAQNFFGGRGGSFDPAEPDLPAKSTTGDQQSTFAEGVNYVRFDNVAPDNTYGDQRIRFLVGNGPDGIGIFNGFEIESLELTTTGVINIDFPGTHTQYTGPGVLDDDGTFWNNLNAGTSANVLNSDGDPTAIDVELAGAFGSGQIGGSNALTSDYYYDTQDAMTLTFSDLEPNRLYDLALFGAQDGFGGRGSTFTIAGYGSLTATADFTSLDANGFREGDTHVIFRNILADAAGQILVNITQEGSNGVAFINGAQITATVIPEPSTLVMAILGFLGLGFCAWGRRSGAPGK